MAAVTRLGLYGGPRAPYAGFSPAAATIALTGTITSATEADIVAGSKTLILTVTNDTWAATVGDDNAITTALIAGLDSDGAEATGWDAVVKAGLTHTAVTRDSDTQVTILLPAFASYDIEADETITATVPASALTGAVETVAAPTFTVSYVAVRTGQAGSSKRKRYKGYPRRVVIDGQVYWVNSAEEERQLLSAWRAEIEAQALQTVVEEGPTSVPARKARVKLKQITRRIEQTDDRQEAWDAVLLQDEEDVIMLLH